MQRISLPWRGGLPHSNFHTRVMHQAFLYGGISEDRADAPNFEIKVVWRNGSMLSSSGDLSGTLACASEDASVEEFNDSDIVLDRLPGGSIKEDHTNSPLSRAERNAESTPATCLRVCKNVG